MQQAACTSIANLQRTRINLLVYIQPLVETFLNALNIYQKRNRLILYENIGILCETTISKASPEVKQAFIDAVVPKLLNHWQGYQNHDKTTCVIIACFLEIFTSCGQLLLGYTEAIFNRCLQILDTNLTYIQDHANPDSDLIVPALQFLSKITETFGNGVQNLIGPSNLLRYLSVCITKKCTKINQEAFSLLGEISPFCMPNIYPMLSEFIPQLLAAIATPTRATGNACWLLGVIIRNSNTGDVITLYGKQIFDSLTLLLGVEGLQLEALENGCICMGCFANKAPEIVASEMSSFFYQWCCGLSKAVKSDEKTCAYFGLCKAVEANPASIFNQNLLHLFDSIVSFEEPSLEIGRQFHGLLQNFKKSIPPTDWENLMSRVRPDVRNQLQSLYNI